jgi:hypothetical protein
MDSTLRLYRIIPRGLRLRTVEEVKYRASVLAVIVQVSFEIITAKDAVIISKNMVYNGF